MSSRISNRRRAQNSPTTDLAVAGQNGSIGTGIDNIFNQFRSAFDDFLAPFAPLALPFSSELGELPTRSAFIDVVDNGDHYAITAELPGFSKEMVDVQVNRDALDLKAEKKVEKNDGNSKAKWMRRERAYSAFRRTIAFPEEVNPAKVEGNMKDGILELKIPKREPTPEERFTKVNLK